MKFSELGDDDDKRAAEGDGIILSRWCCGRGREMITMANGLPKGMASFYHRGCGWYVWLVSPFFDHCIGCLVDAAAPRTSREPVFFSDVPLEDEVLKGYVIGPSGRVLGGRLIPMGCGNSLPWDNPS